jgi:hypothetical protein
VGQDVEASLGRRRLEVAGELLGLGAADATEAGRAASLAMERNLGSGSIRVGMIVARKLT